LRSSGPLLIPFPAICCMERPRTVVLLPLEVLLVVEKAPARVDWATTQNKTKYGRCFQVFALLLLLIPEEVLIVPLLLLTTAATEAHRR
jgi:ABC-type glycerol-3-phosphate transport system permease component